MLEKIYALVLSLQSEIISLTEYNNLLDSLFLENPESELLIDLEFASNNLSETINIVNGFIFKTKQQLNFDAFGSALFDKIYWLYRKNSLPLDEFGRRAYHVWNLLPEEFSGTDRKSTRLNSSH